MTDYVTKEIAARTLGLSPRRVLELSSEGKIGRHESYNPQTRRRQTVLSAADVKRLAGERTPDNLPAVAPPPLVAASPLPAAGSALPALPLWLTLEQAEMYTGLPAEHLQESIAAGELAARDVGIRRGARGRWRVRRNDLDALEGLKVSAPGSARG